MTLTEQESPARGATRGRRLARRRRRDRDAARAGTGITLATPDAAPGIAAEPVARSLAASRRAYARRQRRRQRIAATTPISMPTPGRTVVLKDTSTALDRAPFVAVVIALLGAGIAAVLWLNTLTDEAGMQTSTAKTTSTQLRLSIESLQRDVALLDATGSIAQRAAELGLVPAGDAAMLVIDPNGAVTVVGEPSPVPGPAPLAAPAVDPAAPAPPAAAPPAAAPPAAAPPAAAPPAAAPPAAAPPAAAPPAAAPPAAAPPAAAPPAAPAAAQPTDTAAAPAAGADQ